VYIAEFALKELPRTDAVERLKQSRSKERVNLVVCIGDDFAYEVLAYTISGTVNIGEAV